MASQFKANTKGKWSGILANFGISKEVLNGKHQSCPKCGGKDRFRFDDGRGDGNWICSHCGSGTGSDLLMYVKGWNFREMATNVESVVGTIPIQKSKTPENSSVKRARMQRVWDSSHKIKSGDPVSLWLKNRVGNILYPKCLRYAEGLFYSSDPPTYHPAMVARVDDADGRPTTIHRTYLTMDGGKADLDNQRCLMPGTLPQGSAIRLFNPKGGMLAVSEGIETSLAVVKAFALPTWSLINTANMESFKPPESVKELFIFGDHDKKYAGQAAAYSLAKKLSDKLEVHVIIPDRPGQDWNDVLKERYKNNLENFKKTVA